MTHAAARLDSPDPTEGLGLRGCERELDRALGAALEAFGAQALGLVHLPPLAATGMVPAQLRAAAVLLWLREVEEAGVPAFVEELAEQLATGRFFALMDQGAEALARYWRARHDRHTAQERRAIFSRLFGGPGSTDPNEAFSGDFEALIDGLAPQEYGPGELTRRARIQATAQILGAALSSRAAGSSRFDADRMLADVRTALRLLAMPDIAHALGGGPPFRIVELHAPIILGHPVRPARHLARAQAGFAVIRWLADGAAALRSGLVEVAPGARVSQAAATWLAYR
ncbi:MAG: hypothetical protein ABIO70_16010 [Pseudomonadota bacterium]